MSYKLKIKFDIKGQTTAPLSTMPYDCIVNGGTWYLADRNTNVPEDREGWGMTNIKVYSIPGYSKLCAPNPPFTNDGPQDLTINEDEFPV